MHTADVFVEIAYPKIMTGGEFVTKVGGVSAAMGLVMMEGVIMMMMIVGGRRC